MAAFFNIIKKLLVKSGDLESQKDSSELMEQEKIIDHIETYFGKADSILTDANDEIEIYIISPTVERPCYTLFTQGMSRRPMRVPPGMEGYEYAELMLHMPFYWTPDQRPENFWPVKWLKTLACFPREHDAWLFYGSLIKGKDNGEPFADNTNLSCFTLGATRMLPHDCDRDAFSMLEVSPGKVVYFFTVLPLYLDEAIYRQDHSAEELFDLFDKKNISDIINVHRSMAVVLDESEETV